jgi:TRAP-type C4-dicarboxylate transport system substrate-binding protein
MTKEQQEQQIESAKAKSVTFFTLSDEDKKSLAEMADDAYNHWGEKIGMDYLKAVRTTLK